MPISIVVEKDQFQIFASPRRFPALTILVLVLQILLFNGVTALGVKCEEVFKYNMGGKSCFIQETRINTTHFVIALPDNQTQDHEMTTMRYDGNRDATYLPQKIYYQFPNLLEIYAYSCSLKIVSRDNFRNLRNLTMLDLHDNLIALISFDTFEDLISLKVLELSKKFLIISHFISILIFFSPGHNNIKFMNGRAFEYLENLDEVRLRKNACKTYDATDKNEVKALAKNVTAECGFSETKTN